MAELKKYLLQYLLNNGIMKFSYWSEFSSKCDGSASTSRRDLQSLISEINEKISDHFFRIDIRLCEVSGEKMCVIVNTISDEISKVAPNHSPEELELFSNILTAIMTSGSKCISSILCLNLVSRMNGRMSKDLAQSRIDKWSENGYLVKQDGNIFLGARTISEFETFLRTEFPRRMTNCCLCTDFVYYGKICSECSKVIHNHCLEKYLNKNNNCPSCKKPWKEAESRIYEDSENEEENEDSTDESMDM